MAHKNIFAEIERYCNEALEALRRDHTDEAVTAIVLAREVALSSRIIEQYLQRGAA